jgi:hypothetical protein
MFLLYHSEGYNICELVLHECYVNDLHTITCSGMLGHHILHALANFHAKGIFLWPLQKDKKHITKKAYFSTKFCQFYIYHI